MGLRASTKSRASKDLKMLHEHPATNFSKRPLSSIFLFLEAKRHVGYVSWIRKQLLNDRPSRFEEKLFFFFLALFPRKFNFVFFPFLSLWEIGERKKEKGKRKKEKKKRKTVCGTFFNNSLSCWKFWKEHNRSLLIAIRSFAADSLDPESIIQRAMFWSYSVWNG